VASNAFYEFRQWHARPGCRREAVACGWASGVMLVCLSCGCASEMEALGGRSSLLEAARVEGGAMVSVLDPALEAAAL